MCFTRRAMRKMLKCLGSMLSEWDWKPRSPYGSSVDRDTPHIEIRATYCWREAESSNFLALWNSNQEKHEWNSSRIVQDIAWRIINKHIGTFKEKCPGRHQRQKGKTPEWNPYCNIKTVAGNASHFSVTKYQQQPIIEFYCWKEYASMNCFMWQQRGCLYN